MVLESRKNLSMKNPPCGSFSRGTLWNYAEHQTPEGFNSLQRITSVRHNLGLGMNADGIFLAEKLFGIAIVNSDGKQVPVRYVGEQHVREDLGRIPTAQDWLSQIKPQSWMYGQCSGDANA
jgi:hypothetical protein